MSVLIGRVVKPLKPEDAAVAKEALLTASVRMPERDACADELVAAMSKAPGGTKGTFVEILGAVGGPRALAALAEVVKTGSPELKDSASQSLGEWMSGDAGPVLLDVVRTVKEEKYRNRVLRGYIRLARQFKLPDDQRVDMCRQALEVCQRGDEKKLVLEVLRRIASPPSLAVAVTLLKDPAVKSEASQVAVAIGEKIVKESPRRGGRHDTGHRRGRQSGGGREGQAVGGSGQVRKSGRADLQTACDTNTYECVARLTC